MSSSISLRRSTAFLDLACHVDLPQYMKHELGKCGVQSELHTDFTLNHTLGALPDWSNQGT